MIVTIHQPQYLPWLPYFLKVERSDVFILLDSVDYQKNGLQNRNKIKTAQGAQWLTVPVRHHLGDKICDIRIDDKVDWRRKHWQTLQQNYRKAAAYRRYEAELEGVFGQTWSSLNELNAHLCQLMLVWLGIERPIHRSSQMRARGTASELVLNLCLEAGGTRYVSGVGGRDYLDEAAFLAAGVEIIYLPPVLPVQYPQGYPQAGFIDSLSALDIILNCGEEWRKYVPGRTQR
jgi:hypothetical protein